MTENLTDMEIVLQWAYHLENPCGIEIKGHRHDIRDFYLRESGIVLRNLIDSSAVEFLQGIIDKYNLIISSSR